jgi:hypothetical protein
MVQQVKKLGIRSKFYLSKIRIAAGTFWNLQNIAFNELIIIKNYNFQWTYNNLKISGNSHKTSFPKPLKKFKPQNAYTLSNFNKYSVY